MQHLFSRDYHTFSLTAFLGSIYFCIVEICNTSFFNFCWVFFPQGLAQRFPKGSSLPALSARSNWACSYPKWVVPGNRGRGVYRPTGCRGKWEEQPCAAFFVSLSLFLWDEKFSNTSKVWENSDLWSCSKCSKNELCGICFFPVLLFSIS